MSAVTNSATAIVLLVFGSVVPALAQSNQNRTTPVTVIGTATVRDADNPGRHPFHAELCAKVGETACDAPTKLAVGPGVRAVIEFVSASCVVEGNGVKLVGLGLNTKVDQVAVSHFLSADNPVGDASEARGIISKLTQLYADPETSISPFLVASNWTIGFCQISISGHTITP